MATYGFHPEALLEYAEAAQYYLREASPGVAEAFITAVESAVGGILAAPTQCRVVEEPGIRRYVFRRFPFVLYYHWGTTAGARYHLRRHALQPRAGLLETPNRLTWRMHGTRR